MHVADTISERKETRISDSYPRQDQSAPSADFEVLFDAIPTPVLVLDRNTLQFLKINDAAIDFYGYSRDEFLKLRLADIRPEKLAGEIESMIGRFDDPTLPYTPRLHLTKEGEWRIAKVIAKMITFGGKPAILASIFDITKEQGLHKEIRAARAFLENVVERIPVGLFVKDMTTGQFVFYNSAAETLCGVTRDQFIGKTSTEVFGPDTAERFIELDRLTMEAGPSGIHDEQIIHDPDGCERVVRVKKVAIGDGEVNGQRYILSVVEDITEQTQKEARISHFASHDNLTGLANRWLFQQRISELHVSADADFAHIAIHYIDLDGFKNANDLWGHAMGDSILRMAAERMLDTVRKDDLVARLGGDEFAILQLNVKSEREVRALAERLVSSLAVPYQVGEIDCRISASIGVCYAKLATSIEKIIEEADRALYAAKSAGKSQYVYHNEPTHADIVPIF